MSRDLNYRKYAITDKLAYLVSEVVDEIVAEIKDKGGVNKPFDIFEYNYRMFLNILSESIFGKRYKWGTNRKIKNKHFEIELFFIRLFIF